MMLLTNIEIYIMYKYCMCIWLYMNISSGYSFQIWRIDQGLNLGEVESQSDRNSLTHWSIIQNGNLHRELLGWSRPKGGFMKLHFYREKFAKSWNLIPVLFFGAFWGTGWSTRGYRGLPLAIARSSGYRHWVQVRNGFAVGYGAFLCFWLPVWMIGTKLKRIWGNHRKPSFEPKGQT